ncbi:MAG TPA: hypothetical protein VGM27_04500 [Acidobacteriaceae bacterium]
MSKLLTVYQPATITRNDPRRGYASVRDPGVMELRRALFVLDVRK